MKNIAGCQNKAYPKCGELTKIKNAIKYGIAKVNIFTDLCLAGEKAMQDGIGSGMGYLETRNLKVNAIKEAVKQKILLFGSQNKA